MFMKDEKSYATAMAGIGNMPEVNDLNYLAQNAYTIRNTMLGAGYTHFFSKNFLGKFLLNWYNYKVNENDRRDQFHLVFSVGYLFYFLFKFIEKDIKQLTIYLFTFLNIELFY